MARRKVMREDVREEHRRNCEAAVRTYAQEVGNTIVPDDTVLVGFDEYAARVAHLRPELSRSQRYVVAREVERRQGDPLDPQRFGLPVNVGGDLQAMTMASSFDSCVLNQIPAERARKQAELALLRREWGKQGDPKLR